MDQRTAEAAEWDSLRVFAVAASVLLAVAIVAATGAGAAAGQPSDGGDAGPSGDRLPDLPDSASDVAKNVVGAIDEFTGKVFEAPGRAGRWLGETLRGITPGGGDDEG